MVEVICEDCHEVQTTTVIEAPECDACGSQSLTGTAGYESGDATSGSGRSPESRRGPERVLGVERGG